jgi:hypothetical protein
VRGGALVGMCFAGRGWGSRLALFFIALALIDVIDGWERTFGILAVDGKVMFIRWFNVILVS